MTIRNDAVDTAQVMTVTEASRSKSRDLPAIGWRERVLLPELIPGTLIAKVDTGARTAALHAEDIVVKGKRVHFRLRDGHRLKPCDAPLSGHRVVKNSSGTAELRAVIETAIVIGAKRFRAEITLTDRALMEAPMLLGRATIRGRYLVDPARSFIQTRAKPPRKTP